MSAVGYKGGKFWAEFYPGSGMLDSKRVCSVKRAMGQEEERTQSEILWFLKDDFKHAGEEKVLGVRCWWGLWLDCTWRCDLVPPGGRAR